MANEITIVVKARNETTGVFEGLKRDAALTGDEAGETITRRITEKIKVIKDDPVLRDSGAPIGDTIGETISKRIKEKVKVSIDESVDGDATGSLRTKIDEAIGGKNDTVRKKIKVDVDVDEKTFGAKLKSIFSKASTDASSGSGGFLATLMAPVSAVVGAIGPMWTAAIVAAIPTIGTALSSVVGLAFGGGTIAAGVASALKDPTVSGAVDGLKKRIGGAFAGFGDLFRGPTLNFLNRLPEVFKPLKPLLDTIKQDLAPVAENLSNGVVGFLQNVLPSVGRMVDRSAPILDVLADKLPGIGDQVGRLLDTLSSHSDEAAQFFNGLLDGVKLLLKFLDVLLTISFGAYRTIRDLLTGLVLYGTKAAILLLDAFVGAFGWIPGIRSKLDAAKSHMTDFANKVVRELNKVPDSKTFTLYIRTVGTNAGATLQNIGRILGKAAGGITGSANGATPSGLTWVGENGPELLAAPAGSRVYSNPDSMRMAGGAGGGGGMFAVNLNLDGATVASVIVDPVRRMVSQRFGGSVQLALGKG